MEKYLKFALFVRIPGFISVEGVVLFTMIKKNIFSIQIHYVLSAMILPVSME